MDIVETRYRFYGRNSGNQVHCRHGRDILARVQLHVCASPVSTAAAQQLWACLPNLALQEIYPFRVAEHWAIVDHAPELDVANGYIPISDRPGIGVELNQKTVDPFLCAECKLASSVSRGSA